MSDTSEYFARFAVLPWGYGWEPWIQPCQRSLHLDGWSNLSIVVSSEWDKVVLMCFDEERDQCSSAASWLVSKAQEHVKKTIRTIVHEWGFRYLKPLGWTCRFTMLRAASESGASSIGHITVHHVTSCYITLHVWTVLICIGPEVWLPPLRGNAWKALSPGQPCQSVANVDGSNTRSCWRRCFYFRLGRYLLDVVEALRRKDCLFGAFA